MVRLGLTRNPFGSILKPPGPSIPAQQRAVLVIAMLCIGGRPSAGSQPEAYDVLVYGANAAGVAAAVTASSDNQFTVKVMEPLRMIGGMAAAGGVALMNQGGCGLTGLSRNWSMLCGEHYYGYPTLMTPVGAPFPSMKVSEQAFWTLLRSRSSINVSTGCRVVAVAKDAACIGQVDFLCADDALPVAITATYVIDASYDGDVMTMAGGIDYTSGREARSEHNESLAGVSDQDWKEESFDKQNLTVSPFFDNGTLLPYIDAEALAPIGSADDKLMAFEFFVCLSPTEGNQVPFYPPTDYNPDDFTLLLRQTLAYTKNHEGVGPPLGFFGDVMYYDKINEVKTGNRDALLCCGTGPVDSDQPDLNHGWASANHSRRLEIAQAHRYYTQGSLYFMATDPRVPAATRSSAQGYGYCKDEYAEHGHFPPQLYVRISNRLQGEALLTQNNIVHPQAKPDAVAMGCWSFDQHTVSRHAVPDPKDPSKKVVANEGFFRAGLGTASLDCDLPDVDCEAIDEALGNWYDVPFGTMSPKRGQASNLLVPVVISATSVAYASTRIENMFMDLGSAAGVAVASLLELGKSSGGELGGCPTIAVQDTNVTEVQRVLTTVYGQQIHGPKPIHPPGPHPSAYAVTGAGSTVWNAVYSIGINVYDSRPVYSSRAAGCPAGGPCSLYSYAGTWRLGVIGKEIYYVAKHPAMLPDGSGWQVANGTTPAPTITKS